MGQWDNVTQYELEQELSARDNTIDDLEKRLTKLSDRVVELEEALQTVLFHGVRPSLAKKVRAEPLHLVQDLLDDHGSLSWWVFDSYVDMRVRQYAMFLPAGTDSTELAKRAIKSKLVRKDGRRKSPTYGKFIPGKKRLY